ncbi:MULTISPECIES: lysophospholipid acyltransferase family protein [Thermomonosporaceae]|uniref:lysophospholipid acyltransferase family protein n=1 Tax=Thermomonosporaceae TaxID=2012 RepID=UPI00255A91B6|nr:MULTISPECIES: lysophospholipid acyltransferase family protein [Thermomonosporaceae]MDL4775534.1 lysophospholipid acyltransferase family protein [Actinomadura xylanilytica]
MSEIVYPPVNKTALALFKALNVKFRLEGTDRIPSTGGAVLVSNHVSYLDFIFAGLATHPAKRLVRFMAKKEIFDNRIAGPLMRGMHHIPVDREAGAASYKAALTALKGGEIIGVFAEATISRSFTVKDIKSGAVRMAVAGKVPLIPIAIWGPQRMWTKGHKKRLFQRNVPVTILIGEPMYPKRGDDYDKVTEELHHRMSELLEQAQREYPEEPKPGETWWQPAYLGGSAPTPEEAEALDLKEAADRKAAHQAREVREAEAKAAVEAKAAAAARKAADLRKPGDTVTSVDTTEAAVAGPAQPQPQAESTGKAADEGAAPAADGAGPSDETKQTG